LGPNYYVSFSSLFFMCMCSCGNECFLFCFNRKPSSDLLGLNLFQSPSSSVASTPSGSAMSAGPYSQLQSPPTLSSPRGSPAMPQLEAQTSRYAGKTKTSKSGEQEAYRMWFSDLGDIFAEVGEMQPALPPKQRQTPTPTAGSIAIPRPPSRRGDVKIYLNS
jgi:F-BAR domain only protein